MFLARCGHCPWIIIYILYLIAHGEHGPTRGINVLYFDVMTSIFVMLFNLTFSNLSCLLTWPVLALTEHDTFFPPHNHWARLSERKEAIGPSWFLHLLVVQLAIKHSYKCRHLGRFTLINKKIESACNWKNRKCEKSLAKNYQQNIFF